VPVSAPGVQAAAVYPLPNAQRAGHDPPMADPLPDDWLAAFFDRLVAVGPNVLDAGCGPGMDAATLARKGFAVTAFDRKKPVAGKWLPPVDHLLADVRALPFRPATFDTAIASLSLHYLPWDETLAAFAGVGATVRPGGLFLFRVNASDDVHHGAGQGEEVEPGFFQVPTALVRHAETKRFFTEAAVRAVIPAQFSVLHLVHRTIRRYQHPKQVWECLLTRDA